MAKIPIPNTVEALRHEEAKRRMEAEGVIHRYAIGGAVGATFHLEPVATLDVDVFVAFGDAWQRFAQQFLADEP